jgi:hypothetical protein
MDHAREAGEIGGPALAEGLLGAPDARAVDEDVEGAEAGGGGVQRARHLVGVRDVGGDEVGVVAELLGHVRARRARQVEERHAAARGEEPLRGGAAESGGAARDHCSAGRDLHVGRPPGGDVRAGGVV